MGSDRKMIITCEHGGNSIPQDWQHLFHSAEKTLASHEGYDLGSLRLARILAENCQADLYFTKVSRLLVDCNRSPHHPKLFSRFTKGLTTQEKQKILRAHYLPYRTKVEDRIHQAIDQGGFVLHLSVHSFTPNLNGLARNAEIGLLYDPSRRVEQDFCLHWQQKLKLLLTTMRIRRNYPYRGIADGLTTHLRKNFAQYQYIGMELEVNQNLLIGSDANFSLKLAQDITVPLEQVWTTG